MDLTKFVLPSRVKNVDKDMNYLGKITDLVIINSDLSDPSEDYSVCPTDYAIMNNIKVLQEQGTCSVWSMVPRAKKNVHIIDSKGNISTETVQQTCIGVCPTLKIDAVSVISEINESSGLFKISKRNNKKTDEYYTIEFGEYPKTYVGDELNEELEMLYFSSNLTKTGKSYTGKMNLKSGKPIINCEYTYKGQRYVRVLTSIYNETKYSKGVVAKSDVYSWVKVEPIVWKITNWNNLSRGINPNGTGKDAFISVRTDEAIISGMPFYPFEKFDNSEMWQNSLIRAYLNGYNLYEEFIQGNGILDYNILNFNFKGNNNFLVEALNIPDAKKKLKNAKGEKEDKSKSKSISIEQDELEL